MANDFEIRLKALEGRETIFYQFIDELRSWGVSSRQETAEIRAEVREIRAEAKELLEVANELRAGHKETQTRIDQNERMIVSITVKLDEFGETQRMILRILDRMGESLNDLGRPGKNGNA